MTLKILTNTDKNQKISRKEQEESVEAIYIINLSSNTLPLIH